MSRTSALSLQTDIDISSLFHSKQAWLENKFFTYLKKCWKTPWQSKVMLGIEIKRLWQICRWEEPYQSLPRQTSNNLLFFRSNSTQNFGHTPYAKWFGPWMRFGSFSFPLNQNNGVEKWKVNQKSNHMHHFHILRLCCDKIILAFSQSLQKILNNLASSLGVHYRNGGWVSNHSWCKYEEWLKCMLSLRQYIHFRFGAFIRNS